MKAIILAAGPSTRLRPLTAEIPKCMLPIDGKPLIQNTIELFRKNNVSDISVIRGWKGEKINFPGIAYFENPNFWDNNILHSLMFAREKLEDAIRKNEELIATYSDIWYNNSVVRALLEDKNKISAVVDVEWEEYYEGRTDHPTSEAEKAVFDKQKRILKIGKHINPASFPGLENGEFIGLWKFSPEGIKIFLKHFDRLNAKMKMTEPFQNAKQWQKSYITDIFQENLFPFS